MPNESEFMKTMDFASGVVSFHFCYDEADLIGLVAHDNPFDALVGHFSAYEVGICRTSGFTKGIVAIGKFEFSQDRIPYWDNGVSAMIDERHVDKRELKSAILNKVARESGFSSSIITNGRMSIDLGTKTIFVDGEDTGFKGQHYLILEKLMLNLDQVVSRDKLLEHIDVYGDTSLNSVNVQISKLKKKLKELDIDWVIELSWGEGRVIRRV
jgi:DNA-binding response OmpR family regulator